MSDSIEQMKKALRCLYLEVGVSIADDISKRFETVVKEWQQSQQPEINLTVTGIVQQPKIKQSQEQEQPQTSLEIYLSTIEGILKQINENADLYYPKKIPKKYKLVEITQEQPQDNEELEQAAEKIDKI